MQILHLARLATLSLRYEAEKQPHGGDQISKPQNAVLVDLATQFGVSDDTIRRDVEFARQVQAASEKFGEQANSRGAIRR